MKQVFHGLFGGFQVFELNLAIGHRQRGLCCACVLGCNGQQLAEIKNRFFVIFGSVLRIAQPKQGRRGIATGGVTAQKAQPNILRACEVACSKDCQGRVVVFLFRWFNLKLQTVQAHFERLEFAQPCLEQLQYVFVLDLQFAQVTGQLFVAAAQFGLIDF